MPQISNVQCYNSRYIHHCMPERERGGRGGEETMSDCIYTVEWVDSCDQMESLKSCTWM